MADALSLEIKTPPTGAEAPKPNADPNRPAWLPDKFKTPEEMAASYTELEKKMATNAASTDLSTIDAAKTALSQQGLDFNKLSKEYSDNGKLSDDSMAALKAKGFTEAQVSQFIEGQKAVSRENTKSVHDAVGGKERFDKLMEFAVTKFTADEIKSYNSAVASGDYGTVKLMLQGLNANFEATFGKDAPLTTGRAPTGSADVYENFQAYRNAMSDPRYAKDRNYRAAVDAKLERSTFFMPK